MIPRVFLIFLVLPALISACTAHRPSPVEPESPAECAGPVIEGEKDGGLGGTGNEPQPCEASPGLE